MQSARQKKDMDEKVIQAGKFNAKSSVVESHQYLKELIGSMISLTYLQ